MHGPYRSPSSPPGPSREGVEAQRLANEAIARRERTNRRLTRFALGLVSLAIGGCCFLPNRADRYHPVPAPLGAGSFIAGAVFVVVGLALLLAAAGYLGESRD